MARVLDGIRVPNPGRIVAGSITGMLPADPGAEVVRIGPPDTTPAPRLRQHSRRVPVETRLGPPDTVELTEHGRQPPATRR